MVGNYEIRQGNGVIGTVQVKKEGLYYRFSCRCQLTGEVIHRLALSQDGVNTDLGICVPMEDGFGVEKRMACKVFGNGKAEFQLIPKSDLPGEKFVPVYPDEPFAYLSKLKNAYLALQDERVGIRIWE